MFKVVRKNLKRCAAMLGVLIILALMAVPAFADNSATPTVTTDDEGNITSVPVYLVVQPGDVYNGREYSQSELVFLGNFGAGDIVSFNEVQRSGYYVSSYMFQCRFLNVDIENVYYSTTTSVIVNGSWLQIMSDVVSETFVASGMRIVIFPQFEAGEDDQYHSAAFIRVINALWQNFYTSFIELTSSMNFFGISILSVLGILVTVFVVVTVVKIFHGGS